MNPSNKLITVVIPCYRVKDYVLNVISSIPNYVSKIICVDDKCPENSGKFIKEQCKDNRVLVLFNKKNLGVGGATLKGFQEADRLNSDVILKIDGDGQMDANLISKFVQPILENKADYTKGNRFTNYENLLKMPILRLIGNIILTFLTKLSSGYWNIFDPTNGFICIHRNVFNLLAHEKINHRFFFESDMLFRLYLIKAKILDIPIKTIYNESKSNLVIYKVIIPFLFGNIKNFLKRIIIEYFMINFNYIGICLLSSFFFIITGFYIGAKNLALSSETGIPTISGTIGVTIILILIGFQLFINFINYDIKNYPKETIKDKSLN